MQKDSISKVYLRRIEDWTSKERIGEGLISIWEQMGSTDLIYKDAFTAIKLSLPESDSSGYIKSVWLSNFIGLVKKNTENIFIIETNCFYREKQSNAVGYLHVAHAHGYNIQNLGIPVIIGDGLRGGDSQNVSIRGDHFESVKLAKGIYQSDVLICLSYINLDSQIGFSGCIKNLGMGCAARAGKLLQHSKTLPEVNTKICNGCALCMEVCPANAIGLKKKKAILVKERCIGCGECVIVCKGGAIEIKYDESGAKIQEKIAEYALGVKKALHSNIACINFTNFGLVGGMDPVAVDKASLDILGIDSEPMVQIHHAEKIRLGSSQYELIEG